MHFGWELVARYAYLDYYEPNTPLGPKGTTSGNRLGQSTFGLKWYLADRLRILLITTTLYRMSQLLVRARPVFLEHVSTCIGKKGLSQTLIGELLVFLAFWSFFFRIWISCFWNWKAVIRLIPQTVWIVKASHFRQQNNLHCFTFLSMFWIIR